MKSAEQAQKDGIGPFAVMIAEHIGEEIICANKDKLLAVIDKEINKTPHRKLGKHLLLGAAREILEEVARMSDCANGTT